MGVRKPLALHDGHHTKAELEQMKEENQTATGTRNCFSGKPPKELVGPIAKGEWKRITGILADMEIIGDLDLYALVGYCNAVEFYRRASEELASAPMVCETERGTVKNPLINVQDTFARQMRDFAMKAGLSVDSRLKYAALKTTKQEDDLKDEFGDI